MMGSNRVPGRESGLLGVHRLRPVALETENPEDVPRAQPVELQANRMQVFQPQ